VDVRDECRDMRKSPWVDAAVSHVTVMTFGARLSALYVNSMHTGLV
jgi:hypothetical protein